jgi:hypothetical protein
MAGWMLLPVRDYAQWLITPNRTELDLNGMVKIVGSMKDAGHYMAATLLSQRCPNAYKSPPPEVAPSQEKSQRKPPKCKFVDAVKFRFEVQNDPTEIVASIQPNENFKLPLRRRCMHECKRASSLQNEPSNAALETVG